MEQLAEKAVTELRVTDLHERTGAYMKRVAGGESFVLVDRWGLAVARLVPATEVSV